MSEGAGLGEFPPQSQGDLSNLGRGFCGAAWPHIEKSYTASKSHQNDGTNLTMSIVCSHLTYSVAFSTTEPLLLRAESERHQVSYQAPVKMAPPQQCIDKQEAALPGGDVEAAQRCRGTGTQVRCTLLGDPSASRWGNQINGGPRPNVEQS
jgi:hypothetical protein